jgi:hypothetical protein
MRSIVGPIPCPKSTRERHHGNAFRGPVDHVRTRTHEVSFTVTRSVHHSIPRISEVRIIPINTILSMSQATVAVLRASRAQKCMDFGNCQDEICVCYEEL